MADYIPGPDADFNVWQNNFVTYANANLAALGLVAADMSPITSAQSTWATNFPAHVAAKQAAQAAKAAKDDARRAYVAVIRPLVRRLQASTQVSDAERASLGITVEQTPAPIGPPATAPVCSIECGARLQHTLRFVDETTPTRRAKPPGVLGVEIWHKVGTTPPANEGELRFVAVDTNAPYVVSYDAADGGKTAYYWLRWISPSGERGPWGEQSQATIAA
ncbi:MAG TPA: hypothetical protein VD971_02175 [Phycisphaerales bacterium]|nr:hypothetical protein [Phycisphaerales bacterium]